MAVKGTAFWIGYWVLAAALSVALVNLVPYPFLFVLIIWIVSLVVAFRSSDSSTKRAVCVNIIALLVVFLYLEAHWIKKKAPGDAAPPTSPYTSGYIVEDSLLGYRAAANFQETVTKSVNGAEIYTVTYTTDGRGLRTMPQFSNADGIDCLLFFGGSFTYGEGVEDNEAMPFLVSERSGHTAVNFGLHGYGPHQALAEVQQGEILPQLDCNPTVAVYQAIPAHVKRVAGLGSYGERGPRYELSPSNGVEYTGQYSRDPLAAANQSIWSLLFAKSYIHREYFVDREWIGDDEVALYLAVVSKLKAELQSRYPGLEFDVIFWDTYNRSFTDDLSEGLAKIADNSFLITEMIPELEESPLDYRHPNDGHPNARAHDAMANHLILRLQEAGVVTPADQSDD